MFRRRTSRLARRRWPVRSPPRSPTSWGSRRLSSSGPAPVANPAPGTTVVADYLELLLAALEARGLEYTPVAINVNADVEAPSALGLDVRATDRDVILARNGRIPRKVEKVQEQQRFVSNLTLPTLGGPITILRGWSAIDVNLRGGRIRFINTHLEPSSRARFRSREATELLAESGPTRLPLIMVGDFNSPRRRHGNADVRQPARRGLYGCLEPGQAGRPRASPAATRPTCSPGCRYSTGGSISCSSVAATTSRGLVARRAEVVGDEPGDRLVPSGLWPSDHAGLVATLRVTDRRGRGSGLARPLDRGWSAQPPSRRAGRRSSAIRSSSTSAISAVGSVEVKTRSAERRRSGSISARSTRIWDSSAGSRP